MEATGHDNDSFRPLGQLLPDSDRHRRLACQSSIGFEFLRDGVGAGEVTPRCNVADESFDGGIAGRRITVQTCFEEMIPEIIVVAAASPTGERLKIPTALEVALHQQGFDAWRTAFFRRLSF